MLYRRFIATLVTEWIRVTSCNISIFSIINYSMGCEPTSMKLLGTEHNNISLIN